MEDKQPEFLIDRSLGRVAVPDALKAAGFVVHTLADVYGESEAQRVADVDWLAHAGQQDWVVLSKDDNIRLIMRHAAQPGPYVYGLYDDGVRKLWPLSHPKRLPSEDEATHESSN